MITLVARSMHVARHRLGTFWSVHLLLYHDQVNTVRCWGKLYAGITFPLIFLFCPKFVLCLFICWGFFNHTCPQFFFCLTLTPVICLMMLFCYQGHLCHIHYFPDPPWSLLQVLASPYSAPVGPGTLLAALFLAFIFLFYSLILLEYILQ